MKLKNKRTGEIKDVNVKTIEQPNSVQSYPVYNSYNSLAELNEEWEDVPEEPKEYWYIASNGDIESDTDDEVDLDKECKQIGNYFSSQEEAELALRKFKAWKRLRDKGISFEAKVIDGKWYLTPKAEPQQRTFDEAHDVFKDIMFIFGGKE